MLALKEKSRLVPPDKNGSSSQHYGNDINNTLCDNDNNTLNLSIQDELDNRFTPKKLESLILSEIYKLIDLPNRAERVYCCGSLLEYKVYQEQQKLYKANFCKDRLCPMCNWRRSLKIFGQVSAIMDYLEPEKLRYLFLTLTIKNCSEKELNDTINILFKAWRKLYHENRMFKSTILGTFRALEVTTKRSGDYHPHLHVILAVRPSYFKKNYITQNEWSVLWRDACELDYTPIIHVTSIKETDKSIKKAVAEASKYSVKSSDFLNGSEKQMKDNVKAFLEALSYRRLCSFTGIFAKARKQLQLDDVENGDLINTDNEKIRDDLAFMLVKYQWKSGFYVKA